MAKFIHTSDWHLGHQFHSYDRSDEHRWLLDSMAHIVADERPDALLISGDVFDSQVPSNAVMTLFTEGLNRIRLASPATRIIVIAGNHDSSSRLEINRVLWHELGVEVIGSAHRTDDGSIDFNRHLIAISDSSGTPCAIAVALPFMSRGSYPALTPDTVAGSEERRVAFFAGLQQHLDELRCSLPNGHSLPTVALVHLALSGCDFSGNNPELVGMIDCVDSASIPIDCDYLAMGHIHRRHSVSTNGAPYHAHYCGTPLPVSFEEEGAHGVTVVETDARGKVPTLRFIELEPPLPVVTLPSRTAAFESFDDMLEALRQFNTRAYLRTRLLVDDVAPANAYELAHKAAAEGCGRFCKLQVVKKHEPIEDSLTSVTDAGELREMNPAELASRFYRATNGTDLPAELSKLFDQCALEVIR